MGEFRKCWFCGSDPEGGLDSTVRSLRGCTNCCVDIALKGQWTNKGWPVLQGLSERFGKLLVIKAWGDNLEPKPRQRKPKAIR